MLLNNSNGSKLSLNGNIDYLKALFITLYLLIIIFLPKNKKINGFYPKMIFSYFYSNCYKSEKLSFFHGNYEYPKS